MNAETTTPMPTPLLAVLTFASLLTGLFSFLAERGLSTAAAVAGIGAAFFTIRAARKTHQVRQRQLEQMEAREKRAGRDLDDLEY